MADENDLNIGVNVNPAGAEAGSRRARSAVKGIADGTRDLEGALRRLRSSVDPTFAAMEKYNKAHADNLALMRAGVITRREYNAGMKAAKVAMDQEIQAIERRSAAGRAAAEQERARRAQERADAKAAAQAEANAVREAAAAKRAAERQAREESRRLAAEERAAIREAAREARAASQERIRVEKAAAAEARRAASEARRQEKAEARETARVVREAAREKLRAEKEAAREANAAIREAKRAEREAVREAEREVKRAAREKLNAERQATREALAAEREAKRQQREATREAARVAKESARERAEAERAAARASREAAAEVERLARAERQAANAATELRASIDPAFAAQTRYNETMRQATALLMQNKLQQGEWTKIQQQAKAQMDVNVRSMGQMNSMYVQLGYQAQDVTASLASGINPLVILAQQGGQTAAALSNLGGKAGSVAAFFAGPWGAAIIGATMLLGYLWDSVKEGETATKNLRNAEDRRRMSLRELTDAVREYTEAQKEANNTNEENLRQDTLATLQARARALRELQNGEARLARAQAALDEAREDGRAAAQITALETNVRRAQASVDRLTRSWQQMQEGVVEARAAQIQAFVETSELERRENEERQTAFEAYKDAVTAAGRNTVQQAAAERTYQTELTRIQEHYTALKNEEREARNANAAAARAEGRAIFESREDAIGVAGRALQGEGYNVGENFQFNGGRVGAHPGMGREAHGRYAIDVNIPGSRVESADPVARRRMDEMVRSYQAQGFRVLWNGKVYEPRGDGATYDIRPGQNQHTDHAHIEAPQSIVGQPAGSSLANQLIQDAEELAAEERRINEDRLRDRVSEMEFEQELERENLAEVIRIQDEKIAALTEFYGAQSREVMDANRERVRMVRAQERELLEEERRGIEARLNLMLEGMNRESALREMATEERRAVVDFAEQQGAISPREALVMKAAILDEEFRMEAEHLDRLFQERVAAMREQLELANLPAEQRARINEQIEAEEAQHLTRMAQLHGEYNSQVNAMSRQAAAINMQEWRDFASSFTGSMTQAFQGFWTRSLTAQQAFINMADQQVYRLAELGAQALQDWIMQQVQMTGIQQTQEAARTAAAVGGEAARTTATVAGETARTGAKIAAATTEQSIQTATTAAAVASQAIKTSAAITGAATQQSVGAAAGMAEIGTRAATSAAGAYSSTVVIPFIGPVAAPIAAAGALAAVLGFGALISAKGGAGEITQDGQLARLHAKEMVLPAWIAEPMRRQFVSPRGSGQMMGSAAAAGSAARSEINSRGGDASFYYQPNHTNMGMDMETLLRKDGRMLRKWFQNEVRNGSLRTS